MEYIIIGLLTAYVCAVGSGAVKTNPQKHVYMRADAVCYGTEEYCRRKP